MGMSRISIVEWQPYMGGVLTDTSVAQDKSSTFQCGTAGYFVVPLSEQHDHEITPMLRTLS